MAPLCLAPALAGCAGGLKMDDPSAFARTQSLGSVIAQATDRPVHIVFVHGIRASGPGTAMTFMKGLCRHAPVQCPNPDHLRPAERKPIPLGPWPTDTRVMGSPVWASQADWDASTPFVDRYVFPRAGRPPMVVDEVNWWPLLFPLKCRFLVAPDAQLSGVDKADLELCVDQTPPYHAWLSAAEYDAALQGPRISGGGAIVNAAVKQQLVNWGLSDAVVALGPTRSLLHRTMDGVFAYAAHYDGRDIAGQTFVVVSESLGSFVVMDAAANAEGDAPRAQDVMAGTADLYFFANQFALLDLGRITGLERPSPAGAQARDLMAGGPAAANPEAQGPSSATLLQHWDRTPLPPRPLGEAPPRTRQIIAFSDPSDALTFDVPKQTTADGGEAAIVVNVYDRNEFDWFGLVADPVSAHSGHSGNPDVLKLMFEANAGR